MQKKISKFGLCRLLVLVVMCLGIAMLATSCNESQHPNPKPDDDNVYGEWIIQKNATCEEDGLKYRTNKKGDRQEEIIPAIGHDFGEWTIVKVATELEEGLKESICSRCNDKKEKTIGAVVDGTNGLEFTYWSSEDMYYLTGAGDALEVKDLIIPTRYKGKQIIYVYKDSLNDMPNLETVRFADNSVYTYIYPNAFKGCKKLKSIDIPASITYLPASSFLDCDALETVNVSEDNTSFCSVDGIVYTKDMKSLVVYPQSKNGIYTVPETLTSISYKDIFRAVNYPLSTAYGITGFDVEENNTKYTANAQGILFSKDMKSICAYPLANKTEEYTIDNEGFNKIESYAFANNKYLNTVKVVNGSGYKNISSYAFYNTNIEYLEFDGISTCYEYAIYANSNLKNVVFNSGNSTKFGLHYSAMAFNSLLKKVVLPHVLDETYVNGVLCSPDPFQGCEMLEEISIEQGDSAFVSVNGAIYNKDMTCLLFIPHAKKSLTLPDTLKLINTDALKHNKSLQFENVNGLKYYQNWLVGATDTDITSAIIKEGTIGIAARALISMTLEKLSLPQSLKFLSNSALAEIKTTEFIYHNNFEYIENSAFSKFNYAGGVLDLGSPSYIGDYAIGYTKFEEIKVGFKNNGNHTIIEGSSMGGAFYQSNAKRVMYGPYVTQIGDYACNKMNNLTEVFIASQSVCDDSLNFYNTWRTHYSSVTKTKWIAKDITLGEKVISAITGIMSNFQLVEGETTTVDGITYIKYQR